MKLIRFEFANLKRFAGDGHVFDFAGGRPGLHLIVGINRARPEKGANGVGKTSLWDGIFWTLYGRTPRGQRGTSIRTWRSKGRCYGRLIFDSGDGPRVVERELKSPIVLLLDGRPVDQAAIDAAIGLPADLAEHAILQPQFGDFFFDLQPAPKLALFTTLLDLDHWSAWAKQAGGLAAELERDLGPLRQDQAAAKAAAEAAGRRLDDDLQADQDWLDARRRDRRKVADQLVNAREQVRLRKAAYDKQSVKTDKAVAALKEAQAERDRYGPQGRRTRDLATAGRVARVKAQATLERARSDLAALKKAGDRCPACGQRLEALHREQERERLADEVEAARKAWDTADRAVADAENAHVDAEDEERRLLREEDDARLDLEKERRFLTPADRDLRDAEADRDRIADALAGLDRDRSPYADHVEADRRDLAAAEEALRAVDLKVNAAETDLAAIGYWPTGFRDIRLELIEDALGAFEVETNNQLADLGLIDWALQLDIERETKAGGTMKGFSVSIASPESVDFVPWEAWSGGETQRLRLAGRLGLSSLVMRRLGVDAGIQVLDEPSNHLTPEGVDDLVRLLALRARERGQQVWVIDHRVADSAEVESVTTIVNDKDGARIVGGAPEPPVRRKRLVEPA